MTAHTDLIARLRDGIILHRWVTMKNEAADALEAQAREIAALRDALACELDDTRNAIGPLNAEIDRLRAERDKLDAACKYHADNASKMGRELEATQLQLGEAVALLREARMGVKNSAVQFGYPYTEYVDSIDAFLAKVEDKP